jgi:HD-GYP domain-containing protein (c-di-GMP phosphodiesterase class II)
MPPAARPLHAPPGAWTDVQVVATCSPLYGRGVLRVAELMGSLSLATDLADGFALEKCMRTAVLATRLARAEAAADDEVRLCFWASLLRFTGCTAFAHEEGKHFAAGDDLSLRKTLALVDFGRPLDFIGRALRDIAPAAPLGARVKAVATLLGTPSAPRMHAHAQCEAGISFAMTIGMPDVAEVLRFRDERWDGRGPRAVASEAGLPFAARVADVADVAELFTWNFGAAAAVDELGRRRGGSLDPRLVDRFVADAPELCRDVFDTGAWDAFLAAEPEPHLVADPDDEVRYLEGFARVADVASVFTLGHSRRVADVVKAAAAAAGLDAAGQRLAEKAALAHDLGRVAVPVGIWEKRAALTPFERERIRTHSHHTEAILRLAPALHEVSDVASAAHERGAGAGYHRRLRADDVPPAARLLAAADVFVALESDRPQRPRLARPALEAELRGMVAEGQLDRRAVDAVLGGGAAPRRRRAQDLTEREIEVVRLVAIGRTNPEIGGLLGISPRTAQRHVMNVYQKLGLESRAGLALYALDHDLLD